jgi:heptaprenyl diphosphate synthase
MIDFWADFTTMSGDAGITHALEKVSEIIRSSITSQNSIINDSLSVLFENPGKMLRPGLLLIASQFGNPDEEKSKHENVRHDNARHENAIHLAAALEMLHAATLIHDDIIDDSPLRRGLPAIHSKYGKKDAVLIGDFLLSKAFMLAAEYSSPEQALQLSKVISIICTMEIEQNTSRFQFDHSMRKYVRKIMGKTALLFSLACHIGAHEANAAKHITETLRRIGYNIGMAFQIIDDILDYSGNEKLVRKPLGIDLKAGIVTLPLIFALKKDASGNLTKLCRVPLSDSQQIQQADFGSIMDMVKNLGGIESAKIHAQKMTNRALQEITKLPQGNSRDMLEQLTNKLLARNY